MKITRFLPLLLLIPFITSCGPSRMKMAGQITALENRIYTANPQSFKEKGDTLFNLYTAFIKKFPDDSLAPKYTFNAASVAMNLERSKDAIEYFDLFLTRFPSNPKAPVCMFFKGFIYENQIRDMDKAKEIYLTFIEKYPNNDFADDVRSSLANLGKTPDEMVAAFEKKQKADSTRKADSLKGSAKITHR